MKYKVTIGTVRHNSLTVKKGNFIELSEIQAKPLLASGVIEEVKEEKAKKKKVKPKVPKEAKTEVKEVKVKPVIKAEPSEDWTRKELNDHALSVGVKKPEKVENKLKLLKLISEAKK